jgi:hypothetical protein
MPAAPRCEPGSEQRAVGTGTRIVDGQGDDAVGITIPVDDAAHGQSPSGRMSSSSARTVIPFMSLVRHFQEYEGHATARSPTRSGRGEGDQRVDHEVPGIVQPVDVDC